MRAGLPRLTKPNLELNPSLRKRRAQHRAEAHKAAISEAIRKKWADPAYRERVLKGKSVRSEANGKVLPSLFNALVYPSMFYYDNQRLQRCNTSFVYFFLVRYYLRL